MSTTSLTYFCLEVERNFKRTGIQLLKIGTVFLGPPRNGRATNECSLSQAKRRLLVHTMMKKVITGDEFLNDLKDRMGQVIRFSDSSGYKTRFSKLISTEDDLPKPPGEG